MSDELKPCPFCGGDAFLRDDVSHGTAFFIGCATEECFGEIHWAYTEAEAVASWNTRATPDHLSDPRMRALVEAATAIRDHLDRWQETGAVATAQESKALYDGIDAALRAIEVDVE